MGRDIPRTRRLRYPIHTEVAPGTRAKTMVRKVTYHGKLCLYEHENALQRSQDPKQKQEMRGQTKAQVENSSRETAAMGVTNMCLRP